MFIIMLLITSNLDIVNVKDRDAGFLLRISGGWIRYFGNIENA